MTEDMTSLRSELLNDHLPALKNISDKALERALLSFGDATFKMVERGPELEVCLVHKNGVLKSRAKLQLEGRTAPKSSRSKHVFRTRQKRTPQKSFLDELNRFEEQYQVHAPSLYDSLSDVVTHVIEARDGKVILEFTNQEGVRIVEAEEL